MHPSRSVFSVLAAIATIATASSIFVFAQPPQGGPGPVLGIVEIPQLFVLDSQTGRFSPTAALTLHVSPSPDSKVAATIWSPDAIDSAEYGYEELGALVYGRERGYYLIRTARGVAWLSPEAAGPFHSYEGLIGKGLPYLTEAWEGFVSTSPGGSDRTLPPQSRRPGGNENVHVNGFRTVGDKLWIQIEVMSHSICESSEPPTVKTQGWVPAHDASGAPTVWFYSRGC